MNRTRIFRFYPLFLLVVVGIVLFALVDTCHEGNDPQSLDDIEAVAPGAVEDAPADRSNAPEAPDASGDTSGAAQDPGGPGA